ncbi:MAG TPA: spermidine synthase, partial [Candidatus Xenobia bacterium]
KPDVSNRLLYAGLVGGILLNLALPLDTLLVLPLEVRLAVATALVFCPLFFAGLVFTRSFSGASDAAVSFGSNLLGAIVGGCLEYMSVVSGFHFLWVVALGLYLLSLAVLLRATPRPA